MLSGFVLTLAIQSDARGAYRDFVIRRFCRIYLPFAAAICIAEVLCLLISPQPLVGVNGNIAADWADYSLSSFLRHFLMLGFRSDIQLNGVVWSLIHEMRISLILPGMLLCFSLGFWKSAAGITFASIASALALIALGQAQPYTPATLLNAFLLSGFYLFPFGVGMALAIRRTEILAWAKGRTIWLSAGILGALAVLHPFRFPEWASDYYISIACGGVLVLTLASESLSRKLLNPVLQWLGKVSYSLYLVHLPILLGMLHALSGMAPLALIVASALPVIFVGAHLMNKYVEQGAAALGRRLSQPKPQRVGATEPGCVPLQSEQP